MKTQIEQLEEEIGSFENEPEIEILEEVEEVKAERREDQKMLVSIQKKYEYD
jgi:hypothetical protein